MISYRPLSIVVPPDPLHGTEGKEEHMMVMSVAPAAVQASTAVYGVTADVKPPPEKNDQVVAPISETTNGDAAKSDLNLLKMADPAVGRTVDVKA
jgi:hypothetical protein